MRRRAGSAPGQADIPPAEGAAPEQSASLAVGSLGEPPAVSPEESGRTLSGFDEFGTPRDAFRQQVREEDPAATSGSEASDGEGPPPAAPATSVAGDPLVAVPASPLPVPPTGTALIGSLPPGTAPTPESSAPPAESTRALEADFDVSGEPVVATEGDAIPPETQQFEVESILVDRVVLKLVGGLLPDGTDSVTLLEGESITLYNATARRSYKLKLVDVRPA